MADAPRPKKPSTSKRKPGAGASAMAVEQQEFAKVKQEPLEKPPTITDSSISKEPTILSAEAYTHGGIRKAKFEPKVPARRQKKTAASKSELAEGGDSELPSEIMKLVKQSQEDAAARGARRTDIRAPVRVAFGFGSAVGGRAAAGFHRGGGGGTGGDKKPSIKTVQSEFQDGMVLDDKKEVVKKGPAETWDHSKYYPVTLPLQEPGSFSFDESDDQEFDENAVPTANELELMLESDEDRLLFFQLPSLLPLSNAALAGLARAPEAGLSNRAENVGAVTSLDRLPAGYMGKLRVYSSGAVKLQLGDSVLEAVAGSQCVFAQELVAVNAASKHCCFLGDVRQRVILIPSMDNVLEE